MGAAQPDATLTIDSTNDVGTPREEPFLDEHGRPIIKPGMGADPTDKLLQQQASGLVLEGRHRGRKASFLGGALEPKNAFNLSDNSLLGG